MKGLHKVLDPLPLHSCEMRLPTLTTKVSDGANTSFTWYRLASGSPVCRSARDPRSLARDTIDSAIAHG